MNYVFRDDDINFVTSVSELAAFHAPFEIRNLFHTIAIECDLMDRNHAVNNWIKSHLSELDIQVHGWTHRDYSKCTEQEVRDDLLRCREFIRWKFGVLPTRWYPPWNIDTQEARHGANGAGLIFDNERIEARDFLAGKREEHGKRINTVQLHYWQDLDIIEKILDTAMQEG